MSFPSLFQNDSYRNPEKPIYHFHLKYFSIFLTA
jgi:hypothetical protein